MVTPTGRGFVQRGGGVTVGSYVNASGGQYGTFSNHNLVFFTNNSFGDAVLTTSGNFGIGTLAPMQAECVETNVLCFRHERTS